MSADIGVVGNIVRPVTFVWRLLKVQRSVVSSFDEWPVTTTAVTGLQNLTGCSQPGTAGQQAPLLEISPRKNSDSDCDRHRKWHCRRQGIRRGAMRERSQVVASKPQAQTTQNTNLGRFAKQKQDGTLLGSICKELK